MSITFLSRGIRDYARVRKLFLRLSHFLPVSRSFSFLGFAFQRNVILKLIEVLITR